MVKSLILGKFEAVRNGKPLKYRIQTITPDLIEKVLEAMTPHFLSREPMTSYDRYLDDPLALKQFKDLWRETMSAGASIVALEETADDSINIIGANMTIVASKEDDSKEHPQYEGEKFNKLLAALIDVTEKGNLYERYKVDKYLAAYGLTVHPDYHGYQIGFRLLQCRKPLSESLGITASGTVFTAQVSQHIASKAGFEVLSQQDYKTFKYQGEVGYPNLDGDMKFMGIKYN